MHPLVSVLVPTIGRAAYLPSLIAAAEAQNYPSLEFVVLDNASPMPVVEEFLRPWATRDSRVRLLRVEQRVPMFANFNRGIEAAKGELLCFFHDDDVYRPSFVSDLARAFVGRPRVGFAGSNYDFVDERGTLTEQRRWFSGNRTLYGKEYISDLVTRGRNMLAMPGLMFRREAIAGGFDLNLPIHFGDFTFLMRIAESWDVGLVDAPAMAVRRHSEQASVSMALSRSIVLRTKVLEDYLAEYESRHPGDGSFVQRLRQRVWLGHRVGLAWGWLTAPDGREAHACASALSAQRQPMVGALDVLDRWGVRNRLAGDGVRRVLKRLAPSFRL